MLKLRNGQQRLSEFVASNPDIRQVVCQLPTGYGKTMCIALVYSHLKMRQECNRLFIVVANDTQLQQMKASIVDCNKKLGGSLGRVLQLSREAMLLRTNKGNGLEVVVSTIQMLSSESGATNFVRDLLHHGNWMLAADEIHHYGDGMVWGEAVREVMSHPSCRMTLALSATPFRDGPATIFGAPHIKVRYREAIEEKAVKKFAKYKYDYSVEVEYEGGRIESTHSRQLGDKYEVKRHLRYESGYIQPLLREPAERLLTVRESFQIPAQMIIRAISCRHAKHIAETMGRHCKGLSIDWIGTGDDGRTADENRSIIERFKPTTPEGAKPTLDILVQVGMAGEGFDSVYVCEIVDFALVTLDGSSNQSKQFYGRGSRVIDGCENLTCNINVGTDHPLADAAGSINDWIDADSSEVLDANDDDKPSNDDDFWDKWEPSYIKPTEWDVKHVEAELVDIDIESDEFRGFAMRAKSGLAAVRDVVIDLSDPVDLEMVKEWYLGAMKATVSEEQAKANEEFLRSEIDSIAGKFARNVTLTLMAGYRLRHPEAALSTRNDVFKRTLGKTKKAIRAHYCHRFGGVEEMVLAELKTCLATIIEDHDAYIDGARFPWLS